MDIHTFNQLCTQSSLPNITPEQWNLLMNTTQGKQMMHADIALSSLSLEMIVRSISMTLPLKMEKLGYVHNLQEILNLSEREGKKLFAALHTAEKDKTAAQYLQSLGFTQLARSKPAAPYYSFHVYGAKSALCFSEAQNRKNQFTINVEGAPLLQKSNNAYDWASKIIIQLSAEEMFLLLAVLNGKLHSIQFSGHGEKHDKMMEFHLQGAHYFVRLIQKNRPPISVPMPPINAVNLSSLLYQQIKKNHPHLDMAMLDRMEDQLVRIHSQSMLSPN